MTLETFFDKFNQFADAPDAVAKMRELVLQLAVQGKLVERKESDGNAAKIFSAELPLEAAPRYEVAENWVWIRFAAVGEQRLGKMLDQKGNRGELNSAWSPTSWKNTGYCPAIFSSAKAANQADARFGETQIARCIFRRPFTESVHGKGFSPNTSPSASKWTRRTESSRTTSPARPSSISPDAR
jgi:hypothetical protein